MFRYIFTVRKHFERGNNMKKSLKAILSVVLAVVLAFGTFAGAFGGIDFSVKSSAASRSVVLQSSFWKFYSDGELYITGDIPDYSETIHAPWYNYMTQVKLISLSIEDGKTITKIGAYAFDGIENVTTLSIPKTVKTISADAFKNFKSLNKIYFQGSCEEWDAMYRGTGITVVFEHIHADGQIKNIVTPDCKNEGYTGDVYCKECFSLIRLGEKTPNDSTKHIWSAERLIKEEPTCKEKGVLARQCILCGAWKTDDTESIPATGLHEYELLEENKLEKCEKGVKVTLSCKNCDSVKDYIIQSDEHTYQYQVIDPTCLEDGYTIETCKYCKHYKEKDTVKALGHDASFSFNVPATCTEDGVYGYKCSRCGVICESTKVAAYGHADGEWVVTKDPTCIENGIRELRCKRYDECGEVIKTEEIANLHDNKELRTTTKYIGKEATCVNDGAYFFKCNICGEDILNADGTKLTETILKTPNSHKASRWVTVAVPNCTEPGLMIKKCTVIGCDYHSDNDIGKAIDRASDDAALKILIKIVDDDLVTQINDEILNAYYKLEQAKAEKIAAYIESSLSNKSIVIPDEYISDKVEIINRAAAAIVEEASVNNTKETIIAYLTDAFTEMGNEWIEAAVAAASEKDIELVSLMPVDQQEIPAVGHKYQVVSYYETIVSGKSVYTPVAQSKDGNFYPIEGYVPKEEDGEIVLDKDGDIVYEPILGNDAVDTKVHEVVTNVDCNFGGTLVEQCPVCGEIQPTKVAKGTHDCEITDIKATCTEQGYTEEACKNCTYVARYKYTPSTGHDWEEIIIKDSTCTKTGLKAKKCKNCDMIDETSYKPVAIKRHEYTIKIVAPTCTENGYTVHTCSVCGGSYKDTIVEKLGHDLKDTVVAPTCTEDGYSIHACKTCGYEYKDTITLAAGHQYGEKKEIEATCTADAYTQEICRICGFENRTQVKKGSALGHLYVTDEAVQPTCLHTGRTEGMHCDRCGFVKTAQEIVPIKEHIVITDAAVAATCEKDGRTAGTHCDICRSVLIPQTVIPATGHRVVEDIAIAPTCTTNGRTAGSHCESCGKVYISCNTIYALGHSYSEWEITKAAEPFTPGEKTRICVSCGEEEVMSYKLTFLQGVAWIFNRIFSVIFGLFIG